MKSVHIIVNSGRWTTASIFYLYELPEEREFDRRWHSYTVDLNEFSGQDVLIIFETGSGPAGDYRYDWAGWGEPRLLVP